MNAAKARKTLRSGPFSRVPDDHGGPMLTVLITKPIAELLINKSRHTIVRVCDAVDAKKPIVRAERLGRGCGSPALEVDQNCGRAIDSIVALTIHFPLMVAVDCQGRSADIFADYLAIDTDGPIGSEAPGRCLEMYKGEDYVQRAPGPLSGIGCQKGRGCRSASSRISRAPA